MCLSCLTAIHRKHGPTGQKMPSCSCRRGGLFRITGTIYSPHQNQKKNMISCYGKANAVHFSGAKSKEVSVILNWGQLSQHANSKCCARACRPGCMHITSWDQSPQEQKKWRQIRKKEEKRKKARETTHSPLEEFDSSVYEIIYLQWETYPGLLLTGQVQHPDPLELDLSLQTYYWAQEPSPTPCRWWSLCPPW